MTAAVRVGEVRRWVRRAQSSHRERGETLGNVYFAVLFVAIVGGILHRQLAVVVWPGTPQASLLAGAALAVALTGGTYLALRRLGPLGLSRPAASWLLTAPVSRRRLLLPSLWFAAAGAAAAGALGGLAVLGHATARPVPAPAMLLPAAGALAGVTLLLLALAAQADRWWSARSDDLASLLLAAGVGGLVADSAGLAPGTHPGWPATTVMAGATAALALVVTALLLIAVRGLARTPNDRILEASRTAGTLWDSAYGMEPSFVTEMVERRYWAHRKLRSARLPGRVPVLVAQDLLVLRRRPRRLLWLAGATTLPALLGSAPTWLLALATLVGGLPAGGVTAATIRTDAGNPWMLRMLGLSSRAVVLQRLWVPGILAAAWYAAAFTLLHVLDHLPPGPWWALGLALGPVGAVAAVRKGRTGFVDNSLMPLDTPMGSVATGPLIAALAGLDVLLLGIPTIVHLAQHQPLTWTGVAVQAAVGMFGARAYVSGTTAKDRVELAGT
ncbi:DUF6297 family protein [Couchioplanes caeruleus]|uniref:Uncharacterized protein n=2 Tax=Couchioplanes caeruleus TaxID=56438 RepID=A0A1K0F9N8_9ACTN|nr:DUF6297 family protein [Couchioplanes caeruleus]OJF09573.1 hypothetical protein BG844_36805 [Couchioplanes caeruleus subsp. caeruleus]ROP32349.1 hypothetical protein EDD30_5287 [Couchioplanes caeruleus]